MWTGLDRGSGGLKNFKICVDIVYADDPCSCFLGEHVFLLY